MSKAKSPKGAEISSEYAIVRVAGKQYRVRPGSRIMVNELEAKAGDSIELKEVLLSSHGDSTDLKIGAPLLSGASVKAKVLETKPGVKVIIYKKRRRKGYTKKQGHRQVLSTLLIESISA